MRLEYGKTGLEVEIPDENLVGVFGLQNMPALADVSQAVAGAIQSPIGRPPLAEIARGRQSATIVICDITRPVPNSEVLPPILEVLERSGIPRDNITVLIATGTHRPNEGEELIHLVGSFVAENYRCVNHDCRAEADLVDFGRSKSGVPILFNRHWVEADLKITAGMIEPHFMAGFAGGRKMIMPGVAGLASIQAWHSPQFLEHPLANNGIVEGNPVHEEALAIAKHCPADFIVDVTLNEAKRPWAVFAGDMELAWNAGVEAVRDTTIAQIEEPLDAVITTSGGFPLDLTFYQTVKGMVGALPPLKPGGWIIIASECAEGIGNRHFRDLLFSLETIEGIADRMLSPDWKFVADQWQVEELGKAANGHTIAMISGGIPPEEQKRLFVQPFATVEGALKALKEERGPSVRVAAVPKGPYVILNPVFA